MSNGQLIIYIIFWLGGILFLVIRRPPFWDVKDPNKKSTGVYVAVVIATIAFIQLLIKKCS